MHGAAESWGSLLAFERAAFMDGEVWRLATGFVTHWSATHAAANAVAVGTLALLIARREGVGMLARIALIAFAAQALALLFLSGACEYRGASGFAYAIGAFILVRSARHRPVEVALIAVSGLGYLAGAGMGLFDSPMLPRDVSPDVAVHLAAVLAGSLAAAWPARLQGVVNTSTMPTPVVPPTPVTMAV